MPQIRKSAIRMAVAVIGVAGGLMLGGAIPAGAAINPSDHGHSRDHGRDHGRHHGDHGRHHGDHGRHHGDHGRHHGRHHGDHGRYGYAGARLRMHRAVSCREGHFCAYDRDGFRFKIWDRAVYPMNRYELPRNRMNSGINNSRYKVCVYDAYPHRLLLVVRPHHSFPSMGAWNNRADYIRVVRADRSCMRM